MLRWPIEFPALAVSLVLASSAMAQPLLCEPEGAAPLALAKVETDGTLVTEDGKALRLAGVLWPDELEPKAREKVQATLLGALQGEILSFKPAAPPDRWGIQPVHVFLREQGGSAPAFWLQAGLVEGGVLPGWPDLSDLCWQNLLAHERIARRAHRGFWAPRAQAHRHRGIGRAANENIGRRMVARWKVFSTRKSQVLTYVNITPFFRVGPSIGLTTRQVEALNRRGHPPEKFAGRFVVVRFLSGPAGLSRARLAQGEALMPDED